MINRERSCEVVDVRFWRRRPSREQPQREIAQRQEQKRRSAVADEDYYKAMRRLAIEGGDADGVRHYEQKLRDIEFLRYEVEVLEGRRDER